MSAGTGSPPPLDDRGLPVGYGFKPDWEVTPREARGLLATPGRVLLLDVRRQDEWDKARIPGAVLVPMDQVEKRLEDVEEAAGGKDRPIVVHCHHGVRSLRVTAQLRGHGFTDVRSMAGGIDLWSRDVDGGVPRY